MMIAKSSVIVMMLVAACLCACTGPSADEKRSQRLFAPRDKNAPYDGIDISSHQGKIDWRRVSEDQNIRFVYIKATEGATYQSKHYGYNVDMVRKNGLLVGSYHYFTTTASVRDQFSNFTRLAAPSSQDLVPMIDVEERGKWSRQALADSLQKMISLVADFYGRQPMLYSTMTFYNRNLAPRFNQFKLYVGRYSDKPPVIDWKGGYVIWQYSENGVVAGIDTYVDLCRFADDKWLDDIAL